MTKSQSPAYARALAAASDAIVQAVRLHKGPPGNVLDELVNMAAIRSTSAGMPLIQRLYALPGEAFIQK